MFYWSDVLVFQIQYGSRTAFCSSLKNKTLDQMLTVVRPLMLKVSPVDYGAFYLSDPAFALQDGRGARSWYYQCCTEFSYFQTYSEKHPMRSKMLTIDFYRKWCEDIYGTSTWPSVLRTNIEYGGLHMRATNLIMTNGDEGIFPLMQTPGNGPVSWQTTRTSHREWQTATTAPTARISMPRPRLTPNRSLKLGTSNWLRSRLGSNDDNSYFSNIHHHEDTPGDPASECHRDSGSETSECSLQNFTLANPDPHLGGGRTPFRPLRRLQRYDTSNLGYNLFLEGENKTHISIA